jgi:signal transduction histidine kinase
MAAAVLGAAFTSVILFSHWFPAGYRGGALSTEINAMDGAIAVLVAYLSHGRFVRDRRIRHRLIGHGLAVLGVTTLALPGIGQVLPTVSETSILWASASLRLVGAGLIAAGALSGDRISGTFPRGTGWAVPVVALVGALLLTTAVGDQLAPAIVATGEDTVGSPLLFTSHPLFAAIQVVSAVLFLVASVALTRLAVLHPGDLIGSMGPAFALGTFALFQYSLFPTLATGWVYAGDVLRTGCYALLLAGAAVEMSRYWTGRSHAAVLADRRRLAREIHDGVVQEISFIRMEARSMPWSEGIDRIVDACDRALDEARDAVHALALVDQEPLDHLLQRAAHELSRRYRIEVLVRLEATPVVDSDQRHGLVRIVREAIANAARHGEARLIDVTVAQTELGWTLTIRDDGRGFEPEAIERTAGGYGLISMRERADAPPGRCVVESRPGAGTMVQVWW